jgi:hypothetical protein
MFLSISLLVELLASIESYLGRLACNQCIFTRSNKLERFKNRGFFRVKLCLRD